MPPRSTHLVSQASPPTVGTTAWVIDGRKAHDGLSLDEVRLRQMVRRAAHLGISLRALSEVSDAPPIKARVNHNRWIAECPDCAGAEFVWLDEPLFMCQSCFNGVVGGLWRRVQLPPSVGEVEAALRLRPLPATRNWEPGETPADLHAENAAHGLATAQTVEV
jgi:hypothetical protein